ncbi:hypothetical protein GCM10022226_33840 [Sphaerisporangium flaviroseum]|uniref:DUF2267 domain-containing protein n=1 Tax=Sphaerisporangium flaviroseum TaxID=509199 RepID=A0ABP7I678_9ACTN
MDYTGFLAIVQHEAGLDRQAAETAARVTLETLAQRLTPAQAQALAAHLPDEPARWLQQGNDQGNLYADEFLRWVAQREGVDVLTAERHVNAVLLALSRAVPATVFTRVVSELPEDYQVLIDRALAPVHVSVPLEQFLDGVARRARLNRRDAWRATEAVLETLAERVSGGEVRDLMEELPAELSSALERGNDRSQDAARPMPLDEFLSLVAEREGGVPVDKARAHTRAVFATLRDTLTKKEFHDLTSQLPRVYVAELATA